MRRPALRPWTLTLACLCAPLACDSDASVSDPIIGHYEVTRLRGDPYPFMETEYDTTYKGRGELSLYDDMTGYVDLYRSYEDSYTQQPNEDVTIYDARAIPVEGGGYTLRVSRGDTLYLLDCSLDGDELSCVDPEVEDTVPEDDIDPALWSFRRMAE
ncbi:MAG: hypothetical protein R3A51_05495 [Nannocystaceae bacterium]|nr:hypothetical protein [Myxococcales bacterium]